MQFDYKNVGNRIHDVYTWLYARFVYNKCMQIYNFQVQYKNVQEKPVSYKEFIYLSLVHGVHRGKRVLTSPHRYATGISCLKFKNFNFYNFNVDYNFYLNAISVASMNLYAFRAHVIFIAYTLWICKTEIIRWHIFNRYFSYKNKISKKITNKKQAK